MNETLSRTGEFSVIRRIQELLNKEGADSQGLTVGIGDDAAVFTPQPGYELLVTQDTMVEDRHFIAEYFTYRNLGRRAMVMNISDIGAMGGRPLYALVSLGLKNTSLIHDIEELYYGFLDALNPMEVPIIGGNLTRADHAMFIDITMIGRIKKDNLLRRSTARVGDSILVTGFPGEAAAGLRLLKELNNSTAHTESPLITAYLQPDHRAMEGRVVAESGYATGMIDISDGLSGDLMHICEASHAGAELFTDRLPASDSLRGFALRIGEDVHNLLLGASDDYELLITCHPDNVDKLQSILKAMSSIKVTEIGRITARQGIIETVDSGGKREQVLPHGWDHFGREG